MMKNIKTDLINEFLFLISFNFYKKNAFEYFGLIKK